jgi:hypothetical protein
MKRKRKKQVEAPVLAQEAKPRAASTPIWLHALVIVCLLLANLALYSRTSRLDFLSVDDPDYVQNNPYIESFSAANLKHIATKPYAANYAPMNLLSYAVDVAIAKGKKPSIIHLSSVLWHGFVCCMVYALAFTIREEILFAVAAAGLFALHPAHVEVVAWISSRKDLVATAFAVPAFTFWLLWRRKRQLAAAEVTRLQPSKPPDGSAQPGAFTSLGMSGSWPYLASVFCFLLASAAKQSVLLLPVVMFAWDWLVERRRNVATFLDKIPFGLITLFFGWMTWRAQPSTNHAWNLFVPAASELKNLWLLSGLGDYVVYRDAPNPAAVGALVRVGIVTLAFAVWLVPVLLQRYRQPIRALLVLWMLVQMIPPMLLNFIVPITDRYLFLPSVGACVLIADVVMAGVVFVTRGKATKTVKAVQEAETAGSTQLKLGVNEWRSELLPGSATAGAVSAFVIAVFACVWGFKTSACVNEWLDPRSVWYGAHLKTRNPQVAQFLGEVYHNAGDRINNFIQLGTAPVLTNEVSLAEAVLTNKPAVERLSAEWSGNASSRTNSSAYRDTLWNLAWEEYRDSLANRGELSAPNLFLNRGRLLVSQGKHEQAIAEFKNALLLAEHSTYSVVRQETVTHALRSIGVAYWNMHNYQDALVWYLKAQETQRKSGQRWVPTLDQEVEKLKGLANAHS